MAVRLGSYTEFRDWLREHEAEETKQADAWKQWLMLGLLAVSTIAALVSWAWAGPVADDPSRGAERRLTQGRPA